MYFCCAIFVSSRLLNEILSRAERLQLDGNGNLIHLSFSILARKVCGTLPHTATTN